MRVPTRWYHLVEKNPRKNKSFSMILPQKLFPPLWIIFSGSGLSETLQEKADIHHAAPSRTG